MYFFNKRDKEILALEATSGSHVDSDEVIVSRSNSASSYSLEGKFVDNMFDLLYVNALQIGEINENFKEINELLQKIGHSHIIPEIGIYDSKLSVFKNRISVLQGIIAWAQQNNPGTLQQIKPLIEQCLGKLNQAADQEEKWQKFEDAVLNLVPKIVLFSSFTDVLPSEMPYSEFVTDSIRESKHRIVNDFVKVSGLNMNEFVPSSKTDRANFENRASRVTSDSFGKHWNQGPVELSFKVDGDHVLFFVNDKDGDTLFSPQQRSKGFQWYLSFFLRLTAEGESKNILLIDEPGLYLHAKAQQDVLGLLEELSENNQVIFSTHSPYLIDPQKLSRARLVKNDLKSEDGIKLTDFNTESDIETLTPIITAIGLDITKGLTFPNKQNIIIEGVSDYYYLQGMLHYLKKNESYVFPDDLIFVPCVGNTKVGTVASLLHAYNLHYKILLDTKGSTKTKNSLLSDGINEEQIISVGKKQNDSIEDLFNLEDQKQFDIFGGQGSKTLISRKFYDKITDKKSQIKLSKDTCDHFKELLDQIKLNASTGSIIDTSFSKKVAKEQKEELKERIADMRKEVKL